MSDSPFDFIDSVSSSKRNLIREDGRNPSEYNPYLTNRGLSQHADAIMFVNEMNGRWYLDKQMQYEFLLHALRPRKRFGKWAKKEDSETIDKVAEAFSCSFRRAQEIVDVLGKKKIAGFLTDLERMRGGS